MNYIKNKEVKLHFIEKKNNSSNKWYLFIPGAINSAEEIASDLSTAQFNYYVLSLRGRGKSDSPKENYSLADQASDIESFINKLDKEIELNVFAHSVGVPISIMALSKISRDIKSFSMCEFAPFYPPFDKNWSDNLKKQKVESITEVAIDGLVKDAQYTDVFKELESIESNLNLIVGNNQFSALRNKEKNILQDRIAHLNIETIDGGHDLLNEKPNEIIAFLNANLQ